MARTATQAIRTAKTADPESYPTGVVGGHTPDMGWGGDPSGPIKSLDSTVNSYVGGSTQRVPVGRATTVSFCTGKSADDRELAERHS